MANNKQQVSLFYTTQNDNAYQICLYPMEATLRCPDTYSQMVMVWNSDRTVVWQDDFDTDQIFWSGVETTEKLIAYVKNVIDLTEDKELEDIS